MKKIIYFSITLLILAIIGYLAILNMPKASIKSKAAAYSISAVDLYSEFEKNENQANRKYIGKTIQVEGIISDIDEDKNGATVLFIDSNNPINGTLCTLEPGQKTEFSLDQSIKVKGLCTGFLQDVVLNKCVIVE